MTDRTSDFWTQGMAAWPSRLAGDDLTPRNPLAESNHPSDVLLKAFHPLFDSQPAAQQFYQARAAQRKTQYPDHVVPFLPNDEHQTAPDGSVPYISYGLTASIQTVWNPTLAMCSHGCVVGASDSGKTTVAQPIAIQAINHGAICIILDRKKTWHQLVNLPELAGRVTVLDSKSLRISISQPPPGCNAEDWTPVVIEDFGCAFGRLRAHHLLYDAIRFVNQTLPDGIYASNSQLIQAADEMTRGSRNRKTDNALGLHESLLQMRREMGKVYDVHTSTMIEQMFSKPGHMYIIQPHGESLQQQQFYMAFLLHWIYTHRKETPLGTGTYPIVILVFEDGSCLLDKKLDENSVSGTSPIASTADLCREYSIGLLIVAHSLVTLSAKISRNINTWIVTGLKGEDLAVAKNALGLTDKQARSLLRLGKGEAVGLFPQVNPYAIYFNYPKMEVSL